MKSITFVNVFEHAGFLLVNFNSVPKYPKNLWEVKDGTKK